MPPLMSRAGVVPSFAVVWTTLVVIIRLHYSTVYFDAACCYRVVWSVCLSVGLSVCLSVCWSVMIVSHAEMAEPRWGSRSAHWKGQFWWEGGGPL